MDEACHAVAMMAAPVLTAVDFVDHSEPARFDFWRYWALDNPEWDPCSFDLDRDLAKADVKVGFFVANNSDLGAFRRHKGKLLMYHGLADPVETIRYFGSVAKAMGGRERIDLRLRLFMVPGMTHCSSGPGPNTFDTPRHALPVGDHRIRRLR